MPESSSPSCSVCLFRHVCCRAGPGDGTPRARTLQPGQIEVRAGEHILRQGRPALAVFSLRQGSAKNIYESPLGWRQVTGFSLPGDTLGLEPSEAPTHATSAVALQDAVCCVVSAEAIREQMTAPAFRDAVLDVMRRNDERARILLVAIGSMKAAQRLAMLLLDLDGEHRRRGANDGTLTLAMSRTDIASLLGLTLETVSRLLSRFASVGLISVRQRRLRIIDREGLASVYADLEQAPRRTALSSGETAGEFSEPRPA